MRVHVELVVSPAPYIKIEGEQMRTPRFTRALEVDALALAPGLELNAGGVVWTVGRVTWDLDDDRWYMRTEPLYSPHGAFDLSDDVREWMDDLVRLGWKRT